MITEDIEIIKAYLKAGKNAVIPTETVYGLAASIYSDEAIQSIYKLKNRPFENPLIVHVSNKQQIKNLVTAIHPKIDLLINAFMPGPLTVVLPSNEKVSKYITAGKSTVAIRMPNHSLTRQLIDDLGFPIAAPSANPFQQISPTSAAQVNFYFSKFDLPILDGGPCQCGIESTIVGIVNNEPVLYRKGAISVDEIEKQIGKVTYNAPTIIHMPGMYKKHYSPTTPLKVVRDLSEVTEVEKQKKIGLLTFSELPNSSFFTTIKVLSETQNEKEAIKNFYNYLFELDQANLEQIIAIKIPTTSEFATLINERLEQASN